MLLNFDTSGCWDGCPHHIHTYTCTRTDTLLFRAYTYYPEFRRLSNPRFSFPVSSLIFSLIPFIKLHPVSLSLIVSPLSRLSCLLTSRSHGPSLYILVCTCMFLLLLLINNPPNDTSRHGFSLSLFFFLSLPFPPYYFVFSCSYASSFSLLVSFHLYVFFSVILSFFSSLPFSLFLVYSIAWYLRLSILSSHITSIYYVSFFSFSFPLFLLFFIFFSSLLLLFPPSPRLLCFLLPTLLISSLSLSLLLSLPITRIPLKYSKYSVLNIQC